jgi:hypothetical protein
MSQGGMPNWMSEMMSARAEWDGPNVATKMATVTIVRNR